MSSTNVSQTAAERARVAPPQAFGRPHLLPEMLDLTQAQSLRESMLGLSPESAILLDAGAVERMSTPCVQILLAAGRAAQAVHKSFKITNASDVFRAAIADLGLQSEFSNWMN